MVKTHKVFVYGTLKRGGRFHELLEDSSFLGETSVTGKLYTLDHARFPAAKLGEDGVIHGECYECSNEVRLRLDRLEGHPHFYRATKVESRDFGEVVAYHYVSERVAEVIPEGVFDVRT